MKHMKIAITGVGYVGFANAVLLARHNEVVAYDIDAVKVDSINDRSDYINIKDIDQYIDIKKLKLSATVDKYEAYKRVDIIMLSLPTNYLSGLQSFDTSALEEEISDILLINPKALIVIKSTVPIGFTKRVRKKLNTDNILFSPEFLREGNEIYDILHPSRIIIGEKSKRAKELANLILQGTLKKDAPILFTGSAEAEAIKLFSNTYLAMRVAFFNELDTYAELKGLNTKSIIDGLGMDSRIGDHYNNPSFGYGGYCLPKDSLQLTVDYGLVPSDLMSAIVESNRTRKEHIVTRILGFRPNVVGIYGTAMKKDASNSRGSAVWDIIKQISKHGIKVLVYEPLLTSDRRCEFEITDNIRYFKKNCDIILANRMSPNLEDVKYKVYTRDIYHLG